MPNSFLSLLLFVILLAPGAAFLAIHHRGPYAARSVSALHELTTVVLASVVFDVLALALIRLIGPLAGPFALDVAKVVESPQSYFRSSFDLAALWLAVLLLVSTVLAISCAGMLNRPWLRVGLRESAVGQWILPHTSTKIISGWTWLFREVEPTAFKRVTCEFDDGSRIVGWLNSFNPVALDSVDRDVVLSAPLEYYRKDGPVEVMEYGAVSISARTVRFIHVDDWPELPDAAALGITKGTVS